MPRIPPSQEAKEQPARPKGKGNRGLPLAGYDMPTVTDHLAELHAIQACAEGRATPHQAKLAMDFIVHRVANLGGWAYSPRSTKLTHIMLGRQLVGHTIAGWCTLNLHKLGGHSEPTEHGP